MKIMLCGVRVICPPPPQKGEPRLTHIPNPVPAARPWSPPFQGLLPPSAWLGVAWPSELSKSICRCGPWVIFTVFTYLMTLEPILHLSLNFGRIFFFSPPPEVRQHQDEGQDGAVVGTLDKALPHLDLKSCLCHRPRPFASLTG